MTNGPDLGEQALDKIAEVAISSQLDEAESVDVDIRADAIKVVQGKLDSVAVSGEGMTMKQDLRIESVKVQTSSVAIDPLKVMTGQLELTEPLNAQTRFLLTEADLNRALASDYLRTKMQGLKIKHDGQVISVNIEQATVHLQDNNQIQTDASILLTETHEQKRLSSVSALSLKDDGHQIALEIISAEGEGLTLEFLAALFEQLLQLLNLRNFELGGSSLQLQSLEVRSGQMFVHATTTVKQLPKP
ncbi:DUF2993 domain-containing protein [filamentous cyanobacterium CCP2]|nr:DUF2993 domain-containing protein [filamentous cyanobacterium CCP2]